MLTLRDVVFSYLRGPLVLNGLSLDLHPGLSVLLGPNGAGKTTALRIAAGITLPKTGVAQIDGTQSRQWRSYRRFVGWVPQQPEVLPHLTVGEFVAYSAWLHGVSRREADAAAGRAVSSLQLDDLADRTCSKLSGGQRQRVVIAAAVAHEPSVLLLDEPTASLDPDQRDLFRSLVVELARSRSVLVSTHQTEDLEEMKARVLVMKAGSIVWDGAVRAFGDLAGPGRSAKRMAEAYRVALGEHSARVAS